MEETLSGVGVIDKAVRLLTLLEESPRPLGRLTADGGYSRATTHRLLAALEVHGLVRRDDRGQFALGPRLVVLGRAASTSVPWVAAAGPALTDLRDQTGESVQLYVRAGDRRVCVAALESPHGLRTIVPVGAVLPLDVGSAGAVLRNDPSMLRHGWVSSVAEREPGVASVSAPVRDAAGVVVAAVSVSGPVERTTRAPGPRYGPAVAAAACAVEAAAGISRGADAEPD